MIGTMLRRAGYLALALLMTLSFHVAIPSTAHAAPSGASDSAGRASTPKKTKTKKTTPKKPTGTGNSGKTKIAKPKSAAPKQQSSTARMKHVEKKRAPLSTPIRPFQYERDVRYTTESTKLPGTRTAPCYAVGYDPMFWPPGVVGCTA